MKTTYIITTFLIVMLFTKCGGVGDSTKEALNTTEEQQLKTKADSVAQQQLLDSLSPPDVQQLQAEFIMKYNNNDEMPSTAVSVNINDVVHELKSVSGMVEPIKEEQFLEMDIPNNAIAACGGWWAGAGDYFYMISFGNAINIFHGWQDEMQEESGYHWVLLKKIKI